MLGALRCRGCGPRVSRRCLGCRGRCRGRVPGRGAVPDAPRPRPGARPGPSPAEAPAVGAAAGLRSRHRSRRPHGAPDGAAGPARELSPEPPRYRIPAKTGNPPSPSRAFSPRPLELGVLSAPAPGTGHPAPLSAPSPIPGILPRLGTEHYPSPGPRIRPPGTGCPSHPLPGSGGGSLPARCGGKGMDGGRSSPRGCPPTSQSLHSPGGLWWTPGGIHGRGCVPPSQGRRDNGGKVYFPPGAQTPQRGHEVPQPWRGGFIGANPGLQTSEK